ncbi:Isochorismatase domain-containing protein 2 [Halotydeus destructor]|nr:Isochorismatase domain-containing protein 2 [Halotydeus destructor]
MACRPGLFSVKNTALFLCDLQEKFRPTIQHFPAIVEASARLLKASRLLDVPVIVTEQYPKGLGRTVTELPLQDYPDIKPFEKTQFSMLTNELMESLKAKQPNVKSIILCGIEAHVCVQNTCLNLLDKGYDVHVVVDGCSSRSMIDRMFAFERMKSSGAWLTTCESVILGLLGDSRHPNSKSASSLS